MDLTQIRVDYTHPPCLQSALHNLKSSYASLSHFEHGGGCAHECATPIGKEAGVLTFSSCEFHCTSHERRLMGEIVWGIFFKLVEYF